MDGRSARDERVGGQTAAGGSSGEETGEGDSEVVSTISRLADQERRLQESHVGTGLTPGEKVELQRIETTLDRLWDLLRQRRARRAAGQDPDTASERPVGTVEHYLQ